jgi:hypothetical protein
MDNQTLFYLAGGALAVSAVVVTFLGLRVEKFPGRAGAVVALWFVALVGAVTTFSVLHAQDEKHHKEAELHEAGEEAELEESH